MPLTILAIDDDEVDQIAMRRALRTLAIEADITWVQDAQQALHALRGTHGCRRIPRPHIILLDLSLPGLHGGEFLRRLRADPRLRDSVVFVRSTSEAEPDIRAAYRYNVAGYVVKSSADAGTLRLVEMLDRYWRIVLLPTEDRAGGRTEPADGPPVTSP